MILRYQFLLPVRHHVDTGDARDFSHLLNDLDTQFLTLLALPVWGGPISDDE